MSEVSLGDLRQAALRLLDGVPDGEPLDEQTAALIAFAVRAAPTALDTDGIRIHAELALDAGATPEQVHATLLLVAGLGFHSLAEGSRRVAEVLRRRGHALAPPDRRRIAHDTYWARLDAETPGFRDALQSHSPDGFDAFVAYAGAAWRNGALRARVKELICMAADATPTHRYLPGLRLHLANAVDLGAGTAAILEALAIAAAAPIHHGVAEQQHPRQRRG